MTGKYGVIIKRKYTKIQGDSATGKSVRLCTKDAF